MIIVLDTSQKQTQIREIKPKTIKTGWLPRKQNKNFSQNNKKFP